MSEEHVCRRISSTSLNDQHRATRRSCSCDFEWRLARSLVRATLRMGKSEMLGAEMPNTALLLADPYGGLARCTWRGSYRRCPMYLTACAVFPPIGGRWQLVQRVRTSALAEVFG
jgi:hypothetical protein